MRKHYLNFIIAVVAIIILQVFYLNREYNKYLKDNINIINKELTEAINFEKMERKLPVGRIEYYSSQIYADEMPQDMLDSILKLHPLPTNSTIEKIEIPKYNVRELITDGIINSEADIAEHEWQDRAYKEGNPINIHALDSLLNCQIGETYTKYITITDANDSIISQIGDPNVRYNYKSERIQIGFKGYQYINVWMRIPSSAFIIRFILLLITTLLVISIPVKILLAQLKTIIKNNEELHQREITINGVIHELKSPLARTITSLSVAERLEQDEEKKDELVTNIHSLELMTSKVEMLLNISAESKQTIAVSKRPIKSNKLITHSASLTKHIQQHANKPCEILLTGDAAKRNCALQIDLSLYDTILNNLIDNAIKYSYDEVKIVVDINIDNNNNLCISVNDNGIGIDPEHHDKLFEQYYRVPSTGCKGHGIGLAYVHAAVTACGGEITFESAPKKGTTFFVNL
ncbi:MAG: HAMP domain-containing sensor histidine kinase [bacterium]